MKSQRYSKKGVLIKARNDIEVGVAQYYTIQDLVDLIHMEEGTIRNRLSSGKPMPPSIKIGRRRLFPVDEFDEWVSNIDRIS